MKEVLPSELTISVASSSFWVVVQYLGQSHVSSIYILTCRICTCSHDKFAQLHAAGPTHFCRDWLKLLLMAGPGPTKRMNNRWTDQEGMRGIQKTLKKLRKSDKRKISAIFFFYPLWANCFFRAIERADWKLKSSLSAQGWDSQG